MCFCSYCLYFSLFLIVWINFLPRNGQTLNTGSYIQMTLIVVRCWSSPTWPGSTLQLWGRKLLLQRNKNKAKTQKTMKGVSVSSQTRTIWSSQREKTHTHNLQGATRGPQTPRDRYSVFMGGRRSTSPLSDSSAHRRSLCSFPLRLTEIRCWVR